MSYIEAKGNYNYFVKKITLQKKQITIKKFMGKKSAQMHKEGFIEKNIDELIELEFEKRNKYSTEIKKQIHNTKAFEEMEKLNIELSLLNEIYNNSDKFYSDFAKEFIFNSNNIEGSKIPKERVIEIIQKGDTKYANRNEVKEVFNSIKAMQYLRNNYKFNEQSTKKIYSILTEELTLENNLNYPKGFKKINIVVGNSKTTNPKEVKSEIKDLFKWHKINRKVIHPLILAFDFHLKYESIHPFTDANGRTGRMIMNKILMQNYYNPIIIFKENKQAYFNAIEKAREGKKQKYYEFMIEQAQKTYKQILKNMPKKN